MNKDKEFLLKEKYNGEQTEKFFIDCDRIDSGEPLAYVIGHIPFLNTKIFLDSLPLIPRPETEYWANKAIVEIKNVIKSPKVLDLCAGSGCIGVSVLKSIPESTVDFVEIDKNHHKTIQKNIEKNNINTERAKILGGSLFEKVKDRYDYILSNPPYIDYSLDRIDSSVRENEPELALDGGKDGLEIVFQIIKSVKGHLNDNGVVYIEHEPEQKKSLTELATEYNLKPESFPDQFGIIRYTRLSQTS